MTYNNSKENLPADIQNTESLLLARAFENALKTITDIRYDLNTIKRSIYGNKPEPESGPSAKSQEPNGFVEVMNLVHNGITIELDEIQRIIKELKNFSS
jgi:hypothetical protein